MVEVDAGEAWTLDYGPQSRSEQRDGFLYRFDVDAQPTKLRVARLLEMKGMVVPAQEFPAFLALVAELEKEESRAVRLEAVAE